MYMPGRRRTGSRPSRTVMCSEVYEALAMSISVEERGWRGWRERLGRRHARDLGLALERVPLAAARGDAETTGTDGQLLAVLGLGDEDIFVLGAADAEADDRLGARLDDGDAASGVRQLGELVGLADEGARVAGDDADDVLGLEHPGDADDLVAVRRLGEPPPRARRQLAVGLERDAHAEAALADRGGQGALGRLGRAHGQRADDALAIAEV